jgi:dipeptidyl aminopeptidase/acylaminoacyl peptidase
MPKHYDVGSPSFSPTGKRIAFDANTIGEAPVREIWIVGIDGRGLRKLGNAATPRWFHDESKITYTRDRGRHSTIQSSSDIFECDLATGKEKRLCEGRFADWSPDGKRLAFSRGGEVTENGGTHSDSQIYLAKADGSDPKELVRGDWPSWSPDGKKLAYVVHDEATPPIVWVLDIAAKTRRRLGIGFYRPQWTADSGSVCVLTYAIRDDVRGLVHRPARLYVALDRIDSFLMNLDNPWAPSISPDGKTTIAVVDSKRISEPEDLPPE